MAVSNLLGRPVPGTMVRNVTDRPPFIRAVTIRETFPFVGEVSVAPGEVKEIPAEVAEVWTDPSRWSRQAGWPLDEATDTVIPPISKDTRGRTVVAPVVEDDEEGAAVIEEKALPKRPTVPGK